MRSERNSLASSHALLIGINNENADTSNYAVQPKAPKNYDNFPYKIDKKIRPNTYRESLKAAMFEQPTQNRSSLQVNKKEAQASFEEKLKVELSQHTAKSYSDDVLETIITKLDTPKDFLVRHSISSGLRAKMVDWMIEVLSSYKMSEDSFFKSIYYMDKYLEKSGSQHQTSELHLIGVASMFMATKYQEIHGFKLNTVFEKIAHGKLPKQDILRKQRDILQALMFELEKPTFYELVKHLLYSINITITKSLKQYLDRVVLYLSKMAAHHYELLQKFDYRNIAVGCIYVGLKTLEQVDRSFVPEDHLKALAQHASISQDDILHVGSKILELAKNFAKQYPSLENLKTFNGFCLNKNE